MTQHLTENKTILVTGATGHVGGDLVGRLAAAGVPVRAAARRPERITVPTGVETTRLDLSDPSTLPQALAGVDKVFLYAVPDGVREFVAAAGEAGVRQIVVLSSNTITECVGLPLRKPIADMHRAVEEAVTDSGIDHTFLRPAHFATNVLMWHWPEMIRRDGVVRFPFPESYCDAIHEADIAAVAAVTLTEKGHEGKSYFITGPESVTQREQAELIGRAIGRPVRYEEISLADTRKMLTGETPEWAMDAVLGYWKASDGFPSPVTDTVRELTGRPARSFAQWAQDHAADFR